MRQSCRDARTVSSWWAAFAFGGVLLAQVDVVVALDIVSRRVPELDGPGSARLRLVVSGPVIRGDAGKVARAFATLPLEQFDGVVLHSPGGSVAEGFLIGELLEHLLVRVVVREPFQCSSACFFMYVGAAMRSAHGPPQAATLDVHRGFIRADLAAALSIEELERTLAYEQEVVPRWLKARGVPADIIAIIVAGNVTPLIALRQHDIELIGPRSPGYDAWIEARCAGSGKEAPWTVSELPSPVPDEELAHAQERRQCEARRVETERRYRQSTLQTTLDATERRAALRRPTVSGGAVAIPLR